MERFELVVIAIEDYHDSYPSLPEAAYTGSAVAELLREYGAEPVVRPEGKESLSQSGVLDVLKSWAKAKTPGNSFLYWVGHAQSAGDTHFLIVSDTERAECRTQSIPAYWLVDYLRDNGQRRAASSAAEIPWTVLVLDCCQASIGIDNINSLLTAQPFTKPKRLGLLATTGASAGYTNRFRVELERELSRYIENDQVIPVRSLFQSIADALGGGACFYPFNLQLDATISNRKRSENTFTGSADVLTELRKIMDAYPADQRSHFLLKAQGVEQNELAWYFKGRDAETERLSRWLREAASGMFVVTGGAGSGKSALLGRLLTLADYRLMEALRVAYPSAYVRRKTVRRKMFSIS